MENTDGEEPAETIKRGKKTLSKCMQLCTCRLLLIVSRVSVHNLILSFLVAGQLKYTLCKSLAKAITFVNMYNLCIICPMQTVRKLDEKIFEWVGKSLDGQAGGGHAHAGK